jgi:hypothetical protein
VIARLGPNGVHRHETLARTHTHEAVETHVDLMRNGFPDAVRAAAANALLNRGWGLPRQAVDIAPAKPIHRMSLEEVEAELARLDEGRQSGEIRDQD